MFCSEVYKSWLHHHTKSVVAGYGSEYPSFNYRLTKPTIQAEIDYKKLVIRSLLERGVTLYSPKVMIALTAIRVLKTLLRRNHEVVEYKDSYKIVLV